MSLLTRSELIQEPQVAAGKVPDIVDGIAHHRQPRQAQAEGKAVPLIWIQPARAQHGRMHQTTWQQLDPAALLAHRTALARANQALNVELESRFNEREEPWPQSHGHIPMKDR